MFTNRLCDTLSHQKLFYLQLRLFNLLDWKGLFNTVLRIANVVKKGGR